MGYKKEIDMYEPVSRWLEGYLRSRHKKANIRVFDASKKSLARLINETGFTANLPNEWPSWDIFVDIVGFIMTSRATQLAFVECKNTPLTLRDVSQLLGYSRVALPQYSFILAPQGPSDALLSLLQTFNRLDILNYSYHQGTLPRSIIVGRWDETANTIDIGSIITGDRNRIGKL